MSSTQANLVDDLQLNHALAQGVSARTVRSFAGWKVLITGGSSGIGFALSQLLVREGAKVCIAARDSIRLAEACESLARLLQPDGSAPTYIELDVTSPEAVASAIPRAIAQLGGLDLLINNAGYAQTGYIDELSDDVFTAMLNVNYLGPMRLCLAVLPHFRTQGYGRIVNVTSMLGFMGSFGYSAYCASKHALSGFTECLRQDVLPFNVRVHLAYPPTTLTPGLERENADKPPEAWAIEGKSKAFTPTEVATHLLDGVRRGDFHLLVGFDSWFIWFMQRLTPWLVRRVTDGVLIKALRNRPQLPAQHP